MTILSIGFARALLLIFLIVSLNSFVIQEERPAMTLAEFNQRVTAKDKAVLVYFSAHWCTVCAKMKPQIDEIEAGYGKRLQIIRLDPDRDKEIAQEFEIDALPVLIIYKNGIRQWVHAGLIDKKTLVERIEMNL